MRAPRFMVIALLGFFGVPESVEVKGAPPPVRLKPRKDGDAPTRATAPAPKRVDVKPLEAPKIEVHERGTQPRMQLRYTPRVGSSPLKITMLATVGFGPRSIELPPVIARGTVTVDRVDDEHIHSTHSIDTLNIADGRNTSAHVTKAMRSQLTELSGSSARFVMDRRGRIESGSGEIPSSLPMQQQQTLEQIMHNMARMIAPLPEEAIGEGARWTAVTSYVQNGIALETTTTYELVSVEGDVLHMKMQLEPRLRKKTFLGPGMAAPATITRFTASGSGEHTADLTKLVPRSKGGFATNMVIEVEVGGQKQAQEMSTDMQMQVVSEE